MMGTLGIIILVVLAYLAGTVIGVACTIAIALQRVQAGEVD